MAVLGCGGIVKLKREDPAPATVLPAAFDPATDTLVVPDPGIWSGDRVTLTSSKGLPIDTAENGPDCPDGYAMYRDGTWYVGPNRDHISSDSDSFYLTDGVQFYVRSDEVGFTTSITLYVHRDQLDRLSLYATRAAALNGAALGRIPVYNVDFGQMQVTPATGTGEWEVQGHLSEWSLNLSAPEVDTTSVGERFGESVKSIVTGGGTMDFLVEREGATAVQTVDSTNLMQLLLLTERGCKADAQFWMIEDREASGSLLPGDLYYETSLLVTSVAINTRATDIIAGSLNFVTVGEIKLQMGS